MSLLIFNSSSRVAQGVIRHFSKSGQFQNIVCADLYPHYTSIERFCRFRDQLDDAGSKLKLTDIKISEKSDLVRAISASSHFLYITHDYYALTSSKLNLIKTSAQIAKEQGKKTVVLTPVEYDHYAESDPNTAANNSEVEAKNLNPDLVHVKSDVTFGQDSCVINTLLKRIATGHSVSFSPSAEKLSPIHSQDLSAIVANLLTTDVKGKSYLAKGNKSISWDELVDMLGRALGQPAQLNANALENIISPQSNNFVSENWHPEIYRNMCQFIKNYKTPTGTYEDIKSLNVQLKDLEKEYADNSLNREKYAWVDSYNLGKYMFY